MSDTVLGRVPKVRKKAQVDARASIKTAQFCGVETLPMAEELKRVFYDPETAPKDKATIFRLFLDAGMARELVAQSAGLSKFSRTEVDKSVTNVLNLTVDMTNEQKEQFLLNHIHGNSLTLPEKTDV